MPNSYVEYTTAGSGTNGLGQTTFTAPAQFLSINDIRVKGYNGSSWTELTITEPRGTTTVTLSATPTSGSYSKIRVFRSSTTEALIDFQNGSRLTESDLDTAYRQSLFVAQEVAEDADPEGGSGIGNITNSQLAGGITNDKLAGSISDDKLASGVGTSANNLVKLDSNAKLPAVDGSQLTNTGKVLQVKNFQTGAVAHTTTVLTGDDNIPQNTEGGEFMTLAITPTSATSKLLIEFVVNGSSAAVTTSTVALFQDSTADALAACSVYQAAGTGQLNISGKHFMTAGTTNSTTFKVRAGAHTGNFTLNGHSDTARLNGGVYASSITITEIAA